MAGEICGMALGAGSIMGGITGFAIGVWVHVDFIYPALEATSLTASQASGITAAIALFGGMEAFTGAGILAGIIGIPAAAGVVECLGLAGVGIKNSCSKFGFFDSKRPESNSITPLDTNLQKANV
ncbi:MAG: hypothetical protein WC627_11295 [Legionella sp.]|jgi:hypothetical protein